ncbi:lamin tail domain-containing protein [Actinomadura namibiensis]|uniref:LTD domain-containing protein n=1 Tax=Actinomadura namibiensis TaxID=182080 RepID=A0A7W3QRM4_ACTNM|nr:lamin tail domain-containing protein [Actinomadura namibiensis]MBA8956909.1 hypothetical protein [Actinomadura namibiensis]
MTATAGVGLAATPAQAASAVQIYRVYFDSPGKDTGSNASLNGEWVQLVNTSRSARQLKGYKLRDKTGYTYTFASFTLKGRAKVTIRTGKGRNTTATRYWGRSYLPQVRPVADEPCPIVCDKGCAGAGVEAAAARLGHVLIRPWHVRSGCGNASRRSSGR